MWSRKQKESCGSVSVPWSLPLLLLSLLPGCVRRIKSVLSSIWLSSPAATLSWPGCGAVTILPSICAEWKTGFARIHVFPYSPRPQTPAAELPDQLTSAEKERRARELIALGRKVAQDYLRTWNGLETDLLPEEKINGCWEGYTPEYIRVRLDTGDVCQSGVPVRIRLLGENSDGMLGKLI